MRFTVEIQCQDTSLKSTTFECDVEEFYYYLHMYRVTWFDDMPLQALLFNIEGDKTDEGSLAERAVLSLAEWFGGPVKFIEYITEIAKRSTNVEIDLDDISKISQSIMRKYPPAEPNVTRESDA